MITSTSLNLCMISMLRIIRIYSEGFVNVIALRKVFELEQTFYFKIYKIYRIHLPQPCSFHSHPPLDHLSLLFWLLLAPSFAQSPVDTLQSFHLHSLQGPMLI